MSPDNAPKTTALPEQSLPETGAQPDPGWTRRLLAAYLAEHRDLPWRRTRDPYAIYVSEIMLQQTQVQTVIPYYERFLARFPDPAALAAADPDELHKYWEGLGYYARARQMQEACAMIVSCHGGRLPDDRAALRQLPGIGAYTVGAIRSIAFGHAEPAVDGNVVRVIARIYALSLVQGDAADRERAATLLAPQIPTDQPGDFNQALMELGARICTPARPRCLICPVREDCQAFRQGCTESLPLRKAKKAVPEESLTVAAIRIGPWYRVQRRNAALLKGLYQFDLLPGRLDESAVRAWLAAWLPAGWTATLEPLPDRIHRFTHRLWRLGGYFCAIDIPEQVDHAAVAGVAAATAMPQPDDVDAAAKAVADAGAGDAPFSLVTAMELTALPFPTALAAYRSDVLSIESCNEVFSGS